MLLKNNIEVYNACLRFRADRSQNDSHAQRFVETVHKAGVISYKVLRPTRSALYAYCSVYRTNSPAILAGNGSFPFVQVV